MRAADKMKNTIFSDTLCTRALHKCQWGNSSLDKHCANRQEYFSLFICRVDVDVWQVHERIVREMSEGDLLSDKSASSSTGSVQMSADSTAASTDSMTAPVDMPSATSSVVKITDIPLPDDRPHTISSAVYQPPVRPPVIPDTFEPPPTVIVPVTSGAPDKVADIYSRPSLISSRDARSTVVVAVATPTVPVPVNSVAADDCTYAAPGGIGRLFTDSCQHSCPEPSVLQKRKTVSLTDDLLLLRCIVFG